MTATAETDSGESVGDSPESTAATLARVMWGQIRPNPRKIRANLDQALPWNANEIPHELLEAMMKDASGDSTESMVDSAESAPAHGQWEECIRWQIRPNPRQIRAKLKETQQLRSHSSPLHASAVLLISNGSHEPRNPLKNHPRYLQTIQDTQGTEKV